MAVLINLADMCRHIYMYICIQLVNKVARFTLQRTCLLTYATATPTRTNNNIILFISCTCNCYYYTLHNYYTTCTRTSDVGRSEEALPHLVTMVDTPQHPPIAMQSQCYMHVHACTCTCICTSRLHHPTRTQIISMGGCSY